VAAPANTPIAELTQADYAALPPREHAAVTRLLLDIDAGRIHELTSDNDLTPTQLANERAARAELYFERRYS
jgi:hypothetical protein